ncbi:MAG: ribosome small subunit-dependent GTPase A [Wujia sp.]
MRGKILKGIGGFYYVHCEDGNVYECKAKGSFRNRSIKPAVGDDAVIDIIDENKHLGNISDILPRCNKLIRPAVANVDQAIVVFALADPEPNYNLLDRFLIMMERQEVKSIICLNKNDLVDESKAEEIRSIYAACGYEVMIIHTRALEDDGTASNDIDRLREIIRGKTSVLAGPSGVGKSSVLNILRPDANAKTGEISEKIKRGKHTTRHSELIFIENSTFIMDTPGFASLYVEDMEPQELKNYYEEFAIHQGKCRFSGCVHINEPDCGVKAALEQGLVSRLRYDNYVQMYNELKDKRKW